MGWEVWWVYASVFLARDPQPGGVRNRGKHWQHRETRRVQAWFCIKPHVLFACRECRLRTGVFETLALQDHSNWRLTWL